MVVRIEKKSWWIDFRFNHTRYRKRSPENSRAGALAYEATLRQKLARGELIDEAHERQGNELFETFASRWFEEYVIPNNKYTSQEAKKSILNISLVPFFGKIAVGDITTRTIEQYKAHELKIGVTNKTLKNRLSVLSKCLTTAYDWLQLGGKLPKIVWPKCASYRTEYLSSEECELLLSHAKGNFYEMILTALRTGMRQGELKGLQWSSINWQNQSVTVRHSRCDRAKTLVSPKSNRERHIPLDIDLYEILHKRKKGTGYVFLGRDGQPFNNSCVNYHLAKVCERAGLRKITWHVLRHTFASHLAMKGVPLPAVQALLGHASIVMTMRYSHMAPSTLRSAIDLLNPKRMLDSDFGQPVVNQWQQAQRKEILTKTKTAKSL